MSMEICKKTMVGKASSSKAVKKLQKLWMSLTPLCAVWVSSLPDT